MVSLLIEMKADINSQDNDFCTPLHYSAENGFFEIVRILLKNKANAHLKNYQGVNAVDASLNPNVLKVFE